MKKFFNTIVMGRNNPMHVKYYTYKVEFQERGAGHIHGTLWLNLDKLEELVESEDGKLLPKEDSPLTMPTNENESTDIHPLSGIKSVFKKLKNDEQISQSEKKSLQKGPSAS